MAELSKKCGSTTLMGQVQNIFPHICKVKLAVISEAAISVVLNLSLVMLALFVGFLSRPNFISLFSWASQNINSLTFRNSKQVITETVSLAY